MHRRAHQHRLANLASPAVIPEPRPIAEQLADAMFEQNVLGPCTFDSLTEAGFSPEDIKAHESEARRTANLRFVRQSEPIMGKTIAQIERAAAAIIAELLPPTQFIVAELLAQGLSKREIDLTLKKAKARAALAFCGETPAEAH